MEEQKKEFTGVWIPVKILEDEKLKPIDKLLYAEIASFGDNGCWKKSSELMKICGVKEDAFRASCKRLKENGYISEQRKFGRIYRKSTLGFNQHREKPRDEQLEKPRDEGWEKPRVHIDNNIDNNIDNTNKLVLGETPKYGKPEINKAFDDWEQYTGIKISSKITNNRRACNNLLKKYTADELSRLIMGVAKSQEDKYAPRIADFVDLQQKLSQLILWGKQNSIKKVTIGVV